MPSPPRCKHGVAGEPGEVQPAALPESVQRPRVYPAAERLPGPALTARTCRCQCLLVSGCVNDDDDDDDDYVGVVVVVDVDDYDDDDVWGNNDDDGSYGCNCSDNYELIDITLRFRYLSMGRTIYDVISQ